MDEEEHTETVKTGRGFWDGRKKENGSGVRHRDQSSRSGKQQSGKSTAMAAELTGACIFLQILDLLIEKMNVRSSKRIERITDE